MDDCYVSIGQVPGPVGAGAVVVALPGTLLPCPGGNTTYTLVGEINKAIRGSGCRGESPSVALPPWDRLSGTN